MPEPPTTHPRFGTQHWELGRTDGPTTAGLNGYQSFAMTWHTPNGDPTRYVFRGSNPENWDVTDFTNNPQPYLLTPQNYNKPGFWIFLVRRRRAHARSA